MYEPVTYRIEIVNLSGLVGPTSHLLAQQRLLIGRGAGNDVRLCSPLRVVSEFHVMLYYEDGRYWVRDVGSKNGTWHNEARLTQGVSMVLGEGDRLQVGDFQLTFAADCGLFADTEDATAAHLCGL